MPKNPWAYSFSNAYFVKKCGLSSVVDGIKVRLGHVRLNMFKSSFTS